ncbi:ABC transporter permease [Methanomassiliicoccus luminyensis]|jgi:lipopolysaccharide transport system permease protein|uniref:ABC transporter permease n=1 Tax=Methanomassiliicoccus luminyensis TaxID=1080712 RepID=UPI00036517ED|nr:ABC transporter permease [Methanomassiliicoccus luminyensis]
MAEKKVKVIRPKGSRWELGLGEIWEYRELLYFLVWKQIKTKYKQSVLGIGWAIVQPLLLTFVFGFIFYRLANLSTGGIEPYSFLFAGLILWTFLSGTVTSASLSLIANAPMISKVYFPRVLIPLSLVIAGLLDYAIAAIMVVAVILIMGESISVWAVFTFVPLALTFLLSAGVSFWLSAAAAKYRDVQYVVPFGVSIAMYASPVLYPISWATTDLIRLALNLNPLTGIFTAQRFFIFGRPEMDFLPLLYSIFATLAIFLTGLLYFKHYERQLADVI